MRGKLLAAAVVPAVLGTGLFATAAAGDPAPSPSVSPSVSVSPGAGPSVSPSPAVTPEAPEPEATGPAPDATPAPEESAAPPEEAEKACPELPEDTSGLSKKELMELLEAWEKNACERPGKKLRAGRGGLDGATYTEDVTLTASSLTQTGLSYEGVAKLPTRSGTIDVLKFTMDTATLTDLVQKSEHGTLKADKIVFRDGVTMYTTHMVGWAFGLLKMDLTPENPPVLVPPAITFTGHGGVDVEHTVVTAGSSTITGLRQS
ncbi:hypothetical protein [Actinocorallia longicatena]|uniref:Lipoprotein n=1 Tax=Actinocorallia longicatena TaxID=111803 RepID=A0ABP6QJG3_9ACTN